MSIFKIEIYLQTINKKTHLPSLDPCLHLSEMSPRDVSNDGGVLVDTTKKGNGRKPEKGQIVFAHYTGKLTNGDVFDSSKSKPHRKDIGFYFELGSGGVIKGWDVGFANMTIGEHAILTIKSNYGYGDNGMPGSGINGGDTLVFYVELLDAKFMTNAELDEVDARVEALR